MIVTANLAKGAIAMSKKRVIVKRLNAIQNFGAMDVLCTDKTGTLTKDRIILKRHIDIRGNDSEHGIVTAIRACGLAGGQVAKGMTKIICTITMVRGHICLWIRIRRYWGLFRPSGVFSQNHSRRITPSVCSDLISDRDRPPSVGNSLKTVDTATGMRIVILTQ
jgi:magnesium-transporting ATPase (P-type)